MHTQKKRLRSFGCFVCLCCRVYVLYTGCMHMHVYVNGDVDDDDDVDAGVNTGKHINKLKTAVVV